MSLEGAMFGGLVLYFGLAVVTLIEQLQFAYRHSDVKPAFGGKPINVKPGSGIIFIMFLMAILWPGYWICRRFSKNDKLAKAFTVFTVVCLYLAIGGILASLLVSFLGNKSL